MTDPHYHAIEQNCVDFCAVFGEIIGRETNTAAKKVLPESDSVSLYHARCQRH